MASYFIFFLLIVLQIVNCVAVSASSFSPVLIIGAGAASARLALEFSRQDIPFVIFEATDRVGGRMRQERLGNGPLIELGANWMQGFRKGEPFFDFVTKNVKLKGLNTDFDDVYFTENGTLVRDEIADPVWEVVQESINKVYRLNRKAQARMRDRVTNMDLQAASEFFAGFRPTTPMEIIAWRNLVDFEYAVPASVVSASGLSPIYAPYAPDTEDVFVTDSGGYKRAVEVALKLAGVQDTTRSSRKLRLNSPVRTVRYSDAGAEIVLRNGKSFKGKAVVSTVSLGVLKDSILKHPGTEKPLIFDPPLPWKKRLAISKLVMADYLKIFVQFKTPILTDKDPSFLLPLGCDEGGFISIQNLNKKGYFPGLNAVLVTSTDAYSRDLTCEEDEHVLRDVLEYVSGAAGRKVERSEIEAFVIPRFRQNEFFRGSYSVVPVSMTEKDHEAFNAPAGALFFAGEAHNAEGLYGYVHGAWNNGFAIAKEVIKFLRERE